MRTRSIVASAILVSAVLGLACDDHMGPMGPSRLPAAPSPAPVTSVWNITMRLTSAVGGECVGEMMQSQVNVPTSYLLEFTRAGSSVNVMLRSMSGDYACSFTGGTGDDAGFAFEQKGYFTCETGFVHSGIQCGNGMMRDMATVGQNLTGRIVGTEISGTWDASYSVTPHGDRYSEIAGLETTAVYTGSR